MLTQWNMERPNLLISVTGGAKNFPVTLMDVFRHGLVKAAESTGILLPLCEINCNHLLDRNVLLMLSYRSAQAGYLLGWAKPGTEVYGSGWAGLQTKLYPQSAYKARHCEKSNICHKCMLNA